MKLSKTLTCSAASAAMALTAGIAPVAHADIELGNGLAVTGFVDMSFTYFDVDGASESEQGFGVDQVEVDFLYAGSNGVSAQVDIEYGESGSGNGEDETFVEQAFITKQISDTFSVKGGRFLSYSGWEAEEPTGLYQYSGTGYGGFFYGGYQQGVSAYYDGETIDLMLSLVNDAFDPVEYENESIEVEAGIALQPVEGLTAKLFYITDDGNDTDIVNFWTSYEVADWTFAFEYNTAEYGDDAEGDGFLVMANYAIGDWGFTARYHDFEIDDPGQAFFGLGGENLQNSAITLAPSYAVGENLLLVLEARFDETELDGFDEDSKFYALEALFTF